MAEGKLGENRGNAGKGRPAGAPNKITTILREAILEAGEQHGEDGQGKDGLTGYCRRLAAQEPRAFASLLGRILPTQIDGRLDVQSATKEQRDAAVAAFLRADT